MNIATASLSHTGTRASNQDVIGERIGRRAACFVACDGVAGQPGGDVAARLACNAILSHFDGDKALNAKYIRGCVNEAMQAIAREQHAEHALRRMGTTLVSLFIDRQRRLAWWVHAGDSRLYLFRDGRLHQVTADHSLVQRMKAAGHQTEGVSENLLYLVLGMSSEADEASYCDAVALEEGDVFLLCTDGFWHGIDEALMQQTLQQVTTPQDWLQLMAQSVDAHARKNVAQDNYSAVAIWTGEPPQTVLQQG